MKTLDLETKFSPTGQGEFEGYASLFGGEPDSHGDIIESGAFAASLAKHREEGTAPVLLWQHNQSEPIGVWESITEDRQGLAVRGRLITETERGREAHALMKAKAVSGLSIGFRVIDFERLPGGVRLLKQVELVEISLVSVPALSRARVSSVKSEESMDLEQKATDAPEADETNEPIAALTGVVEGIGKRLDGLEATIGTVKKSAGDLERKLSRPGVVEAKSDDVPVERKAFTHFLRSGREAMPHEEVKALRVSDDTAGGYLAPDEFSREVIKQIVELSPVRQAARVGSTSAGSVTIPKRTGTPTASWVGETEARSETGSTYGQQAIEIHESAAYVDVSQQLLEDAAVNVDSEVATDLAEEFGRLEGVAFVNGNGVKKPHGFMQEANVLYTPSGKADGFLATDVSSDEYPADCLIDLMYALKAAYRSNGAWMMNSSTMATVRKFKDGDGQYIWQNSIAAGQPPTLLGRPVIEAPDMPDIEANAFPIAFGDFGRAYRIYDRLALSVMRDPYTVATSGLVRFHARRRTGGAVVLPEAIRKLKIATS